MEGVYKYYPMKKKYKLGNYYTFDELPVQAQEDFQLQLDENDDREYLFLFTGVWPEEYLEDTFGDSLEEAVDEPYVRQLAKDIKNNGLKSPPVGTEGNHRALAYYKLGEIMPYFKIEEESDDSDYDEEDDDDEESEEEEYEEED